MPVGMKDAAGARPLAAAWFLLALLALALSTLCAVMLVAARVPLPGAFAAPVLWFRSALVLHVSLAVIGWFLCAAAGLWTLAAGGVAGRWRWTAVVVASVGMGAMVLALFLGRVTPVLANYVPVLDSPVFLGGLALFCCAVMMCCLTSGGALWVSWRAGALEVWQWGAGLSMVAAVMAGGALLASLVLGGLPMNAAGFEVLAWGPGHVLQFVHVLLLMSVWSLLGERALGRALMPRRWLLFLLILAAVPILSVPVIYTLFPVSGSEFRSAFTALMRWGSWPAAALLALRLLWQLARAGRAVWGGQGPLLLSAVLFLLGCVFGASIRGESTMVPAHYHGTVGAVTLAYMTLAYLLLPLFGLVVRPGRLVRWQPVLYGLGLLVLASALAWSGWLGVPRKTLHMDVIVQYPAYFAAMGLAGLGGFLAIGGAGMFVVNMIRSLKNAGAAWSLGPGLREVRYAVLMLTLAVTLLMSLVFAYWPRSPDDAAGKSLDMDQQGKQVHVSQKRKEEINRRFAKGVALLNDKQFDAAASEMHRVLELMPQMPEAHVNMGFAMIGTQRYAMAKDFFTVAIDLNNKQLNAYYGLAVALEGLRDLPGALGAMRSYVHLSQADDAYLNKANAAIWEWEAELKKSQDGKGTKRTVKP